MNSTAPSNQGFMTVGSATGIDLPRTHGIFGERVKGSCDKQYAQTALLITNDQTQRGGTLQGPVWASIHSGRASSIL
jgi:hypothetical protein